MRRGKVSTRPGGYWARIMGRCRSPPPSASRCVQALDARQLGVGHAGDDLPGLYFSFPIFFVPLFEEFGWSRGATALAFSISSITQGVLSPVVGTLVDQFGPRRVILSGTFVLGAACLLGSRVGSLWSLYLITGVLSAVGVCAVSWVPRRGAHRALVAAERRGSMMGIAFSGMGAGVLLMGPLAQWLIDGYGWRAAYLVLGGGRSPCWCRSSGSECGTRRPASAPRRGDAVSPAPAPRDAAREIGAALQTPGLLGALLRVSLHAARRLSCRHPPGGVRCGPGVPAPLRGGHLRPHGAPVGRGPHRLRHRGGPDRARDVGRDLVRLTAAGTLCLLGLESWRHAAPLYAYALLFGLGFGARGPIITAIASQLFHGRRFGVIYGILSVGNGIGGGVALVRRSDPRRHRQLSHRVPDRRRVLRDGRRVLLARAAPSSRAVSPRDLFACLPRAF